MNDRVPTTKIENEYQKRDTIGCQAPSKSRDSGTGMTKSGPGRIYKFPPLVRKILPGNSGIPAEM